MAKELLPPPPLADKDQNSYVWRDWFQKLQRSTNTEPVVDNIVLSPTGFIRGGQTAFDVGDGFFLGYSGGEYVFSVGNSVGQKLTYDGTNLFYNGNLAPNIVGTAAILDDAINDLKIAEGAVTAAKTNLAAIDPASGSLAINSVFTNALQADSVTTPKILSGAVTAEKITVDKLTAITAVLGDVVSGTLTGVTITGSLFRTAPSGQRVEIDSLGITLFQGTPANPYGTSAKKYNDSTNKYGSGVLAYVNNTTKAVPFYVNSEQTVADFHYFNRSADPSGAAEIGDTCVVNGKLKICTAAGTPGTWTIVGTQT